MTGPLLDRLTRRVGRADVVVKTDDTLSLAVSADGETRASSSRTRTTHLRVATEGRIGHASTSDDSPDDLAERAIAAAKCGTELDLHLPMPAPLPDVVARAPQAASADVATLEAIARALSERLQRSDRRVEVWAERSSGSVEIANTRGALSSYEVTLAGAGAVVESIGAGYAPPCRVYCSGVALPSLSDLEALVTEVDRRLGPRILAARSRIPAAAPICIAPRAVATFLAPVRAALTGHEALLGSSPLRGRLGEAVFDEKLSLADDPLAPGRPGSRPLDDDGVVARRVPLIERGRLVGLLSDLEVGARAGVPSTGHGWRRSGSGSRVGFTNLRILPGIETRATLLTMMGRGLLVEDLDWHGGSNPIRGTLRLRAPWTYLVVNGSVVGRLEGLRITGNVFDALTRIVGLGADSTWVGPVSAPTLLLEGIGVSGEW